ncbi:uncharacterized protein LOC110094754 isoform X1 [Dendrobium catenatum]|uniref:Uncharacterized protein n=1 Tax=Dendrobium catenatum TaxID=906689 RepID=A0A2I0VV23_9ASPA|nr:uncharacterized protein LOC110094754 isoform X1 [Dendrobium catenatum]PKU67257.1 hypothetical protein MA16_Dca015986 [Dendrobium catenatum]
MAASSPSPSAKVGESLMANTTINGNLKSVTFDTPKQNLRGLNKPKCSKCGNVARSRCPFQSCKSCCAKAQNPCPIHVLKQNGTLPDPSSAIPSFEPHPTDAPSSGASWRLTSLRQLSTAVANSLRARKALTRKDAININKWRFSKLREHIEGNIEVENEAFERYLYNVSLLEEAFLTSDELYTLEDLPEEKIQKLVTSMKVNLKSNPRRVDTNRKRIRNLVNEKLRKLQESEHISDNISVSVNDDELHAYMDLKRPKKLDENRVEKTIETDNLIDKLNKARNKDDLISCMEMKSQLFKLSIDKCAEDDQTGMKKEFDGAVDSSFALPKLCTVVHINQDLISNIHDGFSWTPQLAEL